MGGALETRVSGEESPPEQAKSNDLPSGPSWSTAPRREGSDLRTRSKQTGQFRRLEFRLLLVHFHFHFHFHITFSLMFLSLP